MTTPPVEAELARRQHGVVTTRQLTDANVGSAAIRYRARTGRLHRLHRGVYAVGYVSPSPHTRAMAAVLACGHGAVLSHRSAAVLWELLPRWRGPVEVTAPGRHRHRGVSAHRAATLAPRERTVHHGIPVTTPARTLVDLADVLDDRALARAVNEARVLRLVTLDDVAALLARSRGRRAPARLARFVDRPDQPTRSAFEDAFLVFAERHGLPRPEVNQRIAGHEVDMLWRRQHLVVKLDGRAFHDHDRAFEHDRDRDADLLAHGYSVVRMTWRRLTQRPQREAARLRSLLADSDSRGWSTSERARRGGPSRRRSARLDAPRALSSTD